MNTKRNITKSDQRLQQNMKNITYPAEELKRRKNFLTILIVILVFGLILAFIFAEMPIAGESVLVPGYP
jgi:hypothetical protein